MIALLYLSGHTWSSQFLYMILNGSAAMVPKSKMIDFIDCQPPANFQDRPSPRVILTHLAMDQIPQDVFRKKSKIIVMIRNPKDVITSYYYHLCKFTKVYETHPPPSFSDVLELCMSGEGKILNLN